MGSGNAPDNLIGELSKLFFILLCPLIGSCCVSIPGNFWCKLQNSIKTQENAVGLPSDG